MQLHKFTIISFVKAARRQSGGLYFSSDLLLAIHPSFSQTILRHLIKSISVVKSQMWLEKFTPTFRSSLPYLLHLQGIKKCKICCHVSRQVEIPEICENNIEPKTWKTHKTPIICHNVTMVREVKWTEMGKT